MGKIGAIANMVDPRTSAEGICGYIQEAESQLLVAIDAVLEKLDGILEKTRAKKILVISPADSLPAGMKTLYKLKQKKKSKFSDACISWTAFLKTGEDYLNNSRSLSESQTNQ